MAAVSLLTRKYNQYYAARPVLTTMITNAVRALLYPLRNVHAHYELCVARNRRIVSRDAYCINAEE
jgi:hypothetical protein